MDGDSIFRCVVADRSGIARNLAIGDVVHSLGTKEEAVAAEYSVGGSLNESRSASQMAKRKEELP